MPRTPQEVAAMRREHTTGRAVSAVIAVGHLQARLVASGPGIAAGGGVVSTDDYTVDGKPTVKKTGAWCLGKDPVGSKPILGSDS